MSSFGDDPPALIYTKLQRLTIGPDILSRPKLTDRLEKGRYRSLTLISAPAGYGKSVLASIWANECSCPVAWISLDENDNDLGVFLRYFVAAIQTLFPDTCEEIEALLDAKQTPPLEFLTTTLINDTAVLPEPFTVALDDYHLIENTDIQQLVFTLIHYKSVQMHLMLITRQDPLLGLPSLRVKNQITEIRSDDLCFTEEETRWFLENALGERVNDALVTKLSERTEGWPAGLRLACLVLRDQGDISLILEDFQGSSQQVMGYLLDEVLMQQPQAIQNFLLRTAIFDRFCAPLCDALGSVTTDPDQFMSSQEIIERLIQNNLFIIPLDRQGEWFRYHHLFKELLEHKLHTEDTPSKIAELYVAASAWLAQHGFVEEAINHALASNDEERAAQIMAQHRQKLLNQQQWQRLQRWLDHLPRQLIKHRAHLSLNEAWLLYELNRYEEIPVVLDRINGLLDGDDPTLSDEERVVLAGEANTLWSIAYYVAGQGKHSLDSAQQALDVTPFAHRFVRAYAQAIGIYAYHLIGQGDKAYKRFYRGLAEDEQHGGAYAPRLYWGLAAIELIEGNLQGVEFACKHVIRLGQSPKYHYEEIGSALETLAYIYYIRNDLETADEYGRQVLDLHYKCSVESYASGLAVLARIHQARGETDRARETNEALIDWARESGNVYWLIMAMSEASALALMQGQVPEIGQWATLLEDSISPARLFARPPHLTAAWAHIAQRSPSSLRKAAERLRQVQQAADASHNKWHMIEVFSLQALLKDRQGEPAAALTLLEMAVELAQSGGFIRTFVDLGKPIVKLLAALPGREHRPFVQQLLTSFDLPIVKTTSYDEAQVEHRQPLVDPLTEREMDVLKLLAQDLTNREIGLQLVISPHTVNFHLKNIYTKLHVHGRRQAEKRARDLNLIDTG